MHQPRQFKRGDRIRHKGFRGTIRTIEGDSVGTVEWENGSTSLMSFRELERIDYARNQVSEPKGGRERTN